jgi:retinol dehydrogenase-12
MTVISLLSRKGSMQRQTDLTGKIALVTGATDGIGRVTAEALAKMGAQIIIVGRNPEKTHTAALQIQQGTGQAIETIVADLSSIEGVHSAAGEFLKRHARLHILVNNAGAVFMQRKTSADGLEMTFALNHVAYFLLTNLLLDTLKASAPARIVNVSSGAHIGAKLDFDDLQNQRAYQGYKAYGQSKLANIYFTYELARRLEGSGVTANCLHPGFVATNFGKSNGGIMRPIFALAQLLAKTPEQGARTSIYLSSSPEVEGVTGKYFDDCRVSRSSDVSYDREAAHRLWQVTEEIIGIKARS